MVLFQQMTQGKALEWERWSVEELTRNAVRTLSGVAQDQIDRITGELEDWETYLEEVELAHPDNESVPIDEPVRPVEIPNTQQLREKLSSLLTAVHQLQEALYMPEVAALAERDDVRNYCAMLIKQTVQNQAKIDQKIEAAAQGWRLDRLQKMDHALLRLAVAEMEHGEGVDMATVIDEWVEMANHFSDEEARKFINGILGTLAEETTEVNPGV
jgi:N utilization substance protein B